MPSRWLSLTIIAFWLGTSCWFFWHDLWPDWRPGHGRTNAWTVYNNGRDTFTAETWVDHQVEDDTFVMRSQLSPRPGLIKLITPKWLPQVELRRASGSYRVDRDGNLVGVRAVFWLRTRDENDLILKGLAAAKGFKGDVELTLTGDIRDGKLFPSWHIDNSILAPQDFHFPPIAVPSRGAAATTTGRTRAVTCRAGRPSARRRQGQTPGAAPGPRPGGRPRPRCGP